MSDFGDFVLFSSCIDLGGSEAKDKEIIEETHYERSECGSDGRQRKTSARLCKND